MSIDRAFSKNWRVVVGGYSTLRIWYVGKIRTFSQIQYCVNFATSKLKRIRLYSLEIFIHHAPSILNLGNISPYFIELNFEIYLPNSQIFWHLSKFHIFLQSTEKLETQLKYDSCFRDQSSIVRRETSISHIKISNQYVDWNFQSYIFDKMTNQTILMKAFPFTNNPTEQYPAPWKILAKIRVRRN